ncbi:ANGP4 protein, partial [Nothoprocta ornata]|nr:ANGP4 protein [Nothoprocta ornata]
RLQHLERVLENSTRWLLKLESYIQASVRPEAAQLQRAAAHNRTATMLEIGSSLLNHTAQQTRKLTDVEAQVLNQTSRIELQLLETSLSTSKLEKQLQLQTNEIHKLQNRNNVLELRVLEMESKQQAELAGMRSDKERLQRLLSRQSGAVSAVPCGAGSASCGAAPRWHSVRITFLGKVPVRCRCARLHPTRLHPMEAGSMHTLRAPCHCVPAHRGSRCWVPAPLGPSPVPLPQAFCDMETERGGWTVIQLRANGSVSFQRTWKEYKQVSAAGRAPGPGRCPAQRAAPQGFGEPAGEHWLGNEAVHLLTSRAPYALRVELLDWEGAQALALYERFQLGSERQLYRLALQGYSGTAGQQSGMALQGTNFSTRDADHDNCLCKCAQMLSGGWWFDACGLSNLNGVYYPARHNIRKLNGIRWHHFQGPSYSLKGTRMLIRPAGF